MTTTAARFKTGIATALAISGAVALAGHAFAYLLRTSTAPEVLTEVASPDGAYKAVHSVYLGGAIASHCIDVVSVYRATDRVDGGDESSRVYTGSCHTNGPALRWISKDWLEVGFSMTGALENVAEVRLSKHAVEGKVSVTFAVDD
ncbi:hypothetical protein [Pseudoduganella sp. GCM10020061]|uniref:hypothetical protein n=1 Tax=Pseudoduganella sp. GCM10020061 TaxID=3317345 RepID=UPI00362F15F9